LTPPSSSSNDCDAEDSDWAPSREQKVNILFGRRTKPSASTKEVFAVAYYRIICSDVCDTLSLEIRSCNETLSLFFLVR
jgi:hypothetical protein